MFKVKIAYRCGYITKVKLVFVKITKLEIYKMTINIYAKSKCLVPITTNSYSTSFVRRLVSNGSYDFQFFKIR